MSDASDRTFVFALRNARGDTPYRLKANSGAAVICHCSDCGPIFRCEGGEWLLVIYYDKKCFAEAPKGGGWERCAEARAGLESVGLVEDGDVRGPFASVETWLW